MTHRHFVRCAHQIAGALLTVAMSHAFAAADGAGLRAEGPASSNPGTFSPTPPDLVPELPPKLAPDLVASALAANPTARNTESPNPPPSKLADTKIKNTKIADSKIAASRPTAAVFTRAITLAPHITELIFAAGAGDRIVATVSSSDYPPAASSIPKIGDGMNINVEKIISLKPDMVAAWLPSGAAQTLTPTLLTLQAPLIYSEPKRLDDIPKEILKFGQLFGTEQTAHVTALALQKRLDSLQERYAHRRSVSVFIEVGTSPLYTIGRDPLLNDALRICGGMNIYAQSTLAAPQVSVESVLVAQPDVVITSAGDKADGLSQRIQEWSALHLSAALKQNVYAINPDELFRPGPRLIDATERLCTYLDKAR